MRGSMGALEGEDERLEGRSSAMGAPAAVIGRGTVNELSLALKADPISANERTRRC